MATHCGHGNAPAEYAMNEERIRSWPASCSTFVSSHRCCQHIGQRVLTTSSDGSTHLSPTVRWCSHYVDNTCGLMPKSNKRLYERIFSTFHTTISPQGAHLVKDMNVATESAVPTSIQCSIVTTNPIPTLIYKQLTLYNSETIIMPHQIIWSWYTGRWWVGCYIW